VLYLVTRQLPPGEPDLSFGAPDISDDVKRDSDVAERDTKALRLMLHGALQEIDEINRRVEALRQVIEALLRK
jgi:hypothetical protein